jgi:voltage-gated potassium channel
VIGGLAVFALVVVGGALAYVAAGWSIGDAFYMVVITIFGVGYGEVRPVTTWPLRALTAVVIVAGYGSVLYTVGGFLQAVVDGELNRHLGARRMHRELDRLEGHTIICGYGRMGASLAADLAVLGTPFVAIDISAEQLERAREQHGYPVLVGDASDEEILAEAGISRAAALATVLADDAVNVYVTLTARAMNPDIQILARGEQPSTTSKLLRCGADHVVLPTIIGAAKMSQLITRPSADQILDRLVRHDGRHLSADAASAAGVSGVDGEPPTDDVTTEDVAEGADSIDLVHLGLNVVEVTVEVGSLLIGRTLNEIKITGRAEHLVVGLRRRDGITVVDPPPDTVVDAHDRLVVLGYQDDEPHLTLRHETAGYTYRGAKGTSERPRRGGRESEG